MEQKLKKSRDAQLELENKVLVLEQVNKNIIE